LVVVVHLVKALLINGGVQVVVADRLVLKIFLSPQETQ
jgi:hypothetical protein